ncbi:restriction endonuclease subunit S [Rudaea sp.]|uniref:restriction endonuclease subunit S n=1 Tax=Rudaea sp. TaxID=2136325 RepID=UPI0032202D16
MLPEGWFRRPLGEIARITSGGTPDRAEPSYWGGDIPWVTTGEIQFNTIVDTAEKLTAAGVENSSAKLFSPGTLLMAMYGQGKTRGQVAKLGIAASTNQNSAAIHLQDGHIPDFYFQYLWWKYESIREFGQSGGISHLNAGLLKQISVPVAPAAEQHRIANVLAVWDAAIATTERLLANSRKQKQGLTLKLFFRSRQAGWPLVDFDEVFERVTRKNIEGNTRVLTISGAQGLVSQRDYFNKSVAGANLASYTLLYKGEFAYNKSYSAGYPLGAIKPLLRYDSGVVSSLYLCFRFRDETSASADFFRHYFEAGLLNESISCIAQEGARNHGLLNVGVNDFFKLRLHVPSIEQQSQVASILNAAEQHEKSIEVQLEKLRAEKSALMQQLLTGKRRVRLPARAEARRA